MSICKNQLGFWLYYIHFFALEKTCARLYRENGDDWKDVPVSKTYFFDDSAYGSAARAARLSRLIAVYVGDHYNDNIHQIVVTPGCKLEAFKDWNYAYRNEDKMYHLGHIGTFPDDLPDIDPKILGISSYSCSCTFDVNGK